MVEAATLEWIERRELGRDELRALLSQTLLAILGAQVVLPTITKRAEASKARAK